MEAMNKTQTKIQNQLVQARALIATPERWTQGASDRDANGFDLEGEIYAESNVASHCALGAIWAVYELGQEPELTPWRIVNHLCQTIERHTGQSQESIATWNDKPERTHAEVLQAFDWAIKDSPVGQAADEPTGQ